MATRTHHKEKKAKRRLPFDPTPKKQQYPASLDKENSMNALPREHVHQAASKTQVDESFALNFSTFIDPNRGTTLDLTVSPTSFDLSDMPPSSEEDTMLQNETTAVAGITATTFVLENKVRRDATSSLKAAKHAAEEQRRESERQLKEQQEELERLRRQLQLREQQPVKHERDVLHEAAPEIVASRQQSGLHAAKEPKKNAQLTVRFRSMESLHEAAEKKSSDFQREQIKSASSTTDLQRLRKNALDGEDKKARMHGLRSMTADSEPAAPMTHEQEGPQQRPLDPLDRKARTKSRPQKLKMLKAISTLDVGSLDLVNVEQGLCMRSPSSKLGYATLRAESGTPKATALSMQWPGDGPDNGSRGEVHQMAPSIEEEEEAVTSDEEEGGSDESESMDDAMKSDSVVEQSVILAQEDNQYSLFVAPTPAKAAPVVRVDAQLQAKDLLNAPVNLATQRSLEQLDYVTSDPKLAGLFGEHLKGLRADAMLRILDDITEFKGLMSASERLSLARSIFQMYLSDNPARENAIAKDVVDEATRSSVKKKIRAEQCDEDLFEDAEEAIRHHLALKEMPTFVKGDVYRTLGFKRGKSRSRKTSVQTAFSQEEETAESEASLSQNALFKKIVVEGDNEEPVVEQQEEEEEEEDEESDQEEESSDASPLSMKEATLPEVNRSMELKSNTTMDSILADPQELETFLSFVEASDEKSAQKTGSNVAFLLKVAQFNQAAEQERPEVARTIYDSFLASPEKASETMRRDQKGQVDVDVSELRKRQLVSRFRNMLEEEAQQTESPARQLQAGFFDKAAKDVEAFVEPHLNKYMAAKRDGTLAKMKRRQVPTATTVAALFKPVKNEAAPSMAAPIVVSKDAQLSTASAEVLDAFVAFASDIGRGDAALFLCELHSFRRIEDAAERTRVAKSVMERFIHRSGEHALNIADHIRSGPEMRWGIFAKRNLIKTDFFDSVSDEVMQSLEADTWPRFVNEHATCKSDVSSILSESSGLEESKVNFDFGLTIQRGEIEEEIRRRLREEAAADSSEDSDSGVEDSPDVPPSAPGTVSSRGLDLSPSTAADLLSRLDDEAMSLNDTVMLSRPPPSQPAAQIIFAEAEVSELEILPSTRPQTFIPVQRAASEGVTKRMPAANPLGVWPSRSAKLTFAEGIDGKRRQRFVVLKNKSLYVFSSELDYRKSKEPKATMDTDDLVRLNIVREGSKWTLRIYFEGLQKVVILGSETQKTLLDWKRALLESAPHVTL